MRIKNQWLGAIAAIAITLMAGGVFADEAEYQLTFEGRWSADLPRPGGAHFSPLIGATHNADGSIFTVGELASQGVENVAEIGSNAALTNELNDGMAAGTVDQLITRSGNVGPTQTVTINFVAKPDHSLLSLITMIAPSPDWFSGFDSVDLQDANGQWLDQIVIDLNSYDAGTEEGNSFSLSNPPTVPQDVIQDLDTAVPDGPLFGVGSIARVTLTRIVPQFETVVPDSAEVTRGVLMSGGIAELADSDNLDLVATRNSSDVQSRVFLEVKGTSPTETPSAIEFLIEGAVFARSTVVQSIDMWDYDATEWVEVDSRNAARFTDASATVSATGDCARFVEAGTSCILVRCRFQSINPRQQFSANIDQTVWSIAD